MGVFSVYVLESQPVMYAGLERVLKADRRFEPVGCTAEMDQAVDYVARLGPDLLLISEVEVTRAVLHCLHRVQECKTGCAPVLWVNTLHNTDTVRAMQAGARGVARKNLPVHEFLDCLYTVACGGAWVEDALLPSMSGAQYAPVERPSISAREKQVIELICRNLKNKEIAQEMGIAESTVKVHLLHIYEKTGVIDRFQLAMQGRRILAEPDDAKGA